MTCAPVLLIRPAIAHETLAALYDSLPPPVTDTQEARDALYDKAMAAIAALRPANAFEAELAARTEAEHFAAIYPDRAARIRANRGLPPRLDFGPPEPELVDAIGNGTSPILFALDHHPKAVAA